MKRLCLLALIAVSVLVGCSSGGTTTAEDQGDDTSKEVPFELNAAPVETTKVTAMKSYRFDPAVIEVTAGSKVTWTNEDDFPHNIHLLTGADETHDLPIGASVDLTFDDPGDFYYECSIHPQQMRGKVIVTD